MPLPRPFRTDSNSWHLSEPHCGGGSSQGPRKEEPGFVPKEVQGQNHAMLGQGKELHTRIPGAYHLLGCPETQGPKPRIPAQVTGAQSLYLERSTSAATQNSQIKKWGMSGWQRNSEERNGSPPDKKKIPRVISLGHLPPSSCSQSPSSQHKPVPRGRQPLLSEPKAY